MDKLYFNSKELARIRRVVASFFRRLPTLVQGNFFPTVRADVQNVKFLAINQGKIEVSNYLCSIWTFDQKDPKLRA